MKIGFVGLGLMGSRMANNLLHKENQLFVYNRTKEKAKSLIDNGAVISNSVSELALQSEVVITMLSEPGVVIEAALGENGFLKHLKKRSVWIDCSTVNPSFSKAMAEEAKKQEVRFLDAPVSGTILPAEKGELTFLIGGEKNDVEYCRPLFEAMGKKILHIGENGKGTSMKMVINLLLGQAMVAFSEGMLLGESLGISKEQIMEIILGGPVVAPFLSGKKDKLLKNNFETEFPLQWMLKDLRLALTSAQENNLTLPLTSSAEKVFNLANESGLGEEDFSAVYNYLNGKN
ncbi:MAG TPA: NAD(P)-dependent oxidoreductase [Ignavibacteriaceae bacterium]|nr:NAD(P)-dependent oxidoreductase [Ignavibacteriaceae bacterium]